MIVQLIIRLNTPRPKEELRQSNNTSTADPPLCARLAREHDLFKHSKVFIKLFVVQVYTYGVRDESHESLSHHYRL